MIIQSFQGSVWVPGEAGYREALGLSQQSGLEMTVTVWPQQEGQAVDRFRIWPGGSARFC